MLNRPTIRNSNIHNTIAVIYKRSFLYGISDKRMDGYSSVTSYSWSTKDVFSMLLASYNVDINFITS